MIEMEKIISEVFSDIKTVIRDMGDLKSSNARLETGQEFMKKEIERINESVKNIPITCETGKKSVEFISAHKKEHEDAVAAKDKADDKKDQKRFGWGGFIFGLIGTLITIGSAAAAVWIFFNH